MLFAEANLLRNLNHKNIVKILDCYTFKDLRAYFIMEYLSGVLYLPKGDLHQYIQTQPDSKLPEQEAQVFFKQMVDAIYYCHFQNIIHRDLKLQNILIEDLVEKKIKICDFGIAGICCH